PAVLSSAGRECRDGIYRLCFRTEPARRLQRRPRASSADPRDVRPSAERRLCAEAGMEALRGQSCIASRKTKSEAQGPAFGSMELEPDQLACFALSCSSLSFLAKSSLFLATKSWSFFWRSSMSDCFNGSPS